MDKPPQIFEPKVVVPEKVTQDISRMTILPVGEVQSVVGNVLSFGPRIMIPNTEILNVGTSLCLQDKTKIGKIQDILGLVQQPVYTCAVNSLLVPRLQKGMTIYWVPDISKKLEDGDIDHTKASDLADDENGPEFFSDDEAEAAYKKTRALTRKRPLENGKNPARKKRTLRPNNPRSFPRPRNNYSGNFPRPPVNRPLVAPHQRPASMPPSYPPNPPSYPPNPPGYQHNYHAPPPPTNASYPPPPQQNYRGQHKNSQYYQPPPAHQPPPPQQFGNQNPPAPVRPIFSKPAVPFWRQ